MDRPKIKISSLRIAFQLLLHLVLVSHVLAYYFLDWTDVGGLDFQAFFHDFLSHGLLTAGAILALAAFVFTLVFGRIFCSWGCHFGAFQDLAAWVLRRFKVPLPFVKLRFLHWLPYLLLVLIFCVPAVQTWSQETAFRLEVDIGANPPWSTFPGLIGSVATFSACGIGILLFLGSRGFCRFVCPYGAMFRILDPIAPFRIRKAEACPQTCSTEATQPPPCTAACPTAVNVHDEVEASGSVRDVDCVRCHLCVEACPNDALRYSLPVLRAPTAAPGPPRTFQAPRSTLTVGEEVLVLIVTVASFLAWDLTLAAHFLAATLALGEGFLVLVAFRTVRRPTFQLGAIGLRRDGRWTIAGVGMIVVLLLSLVPLARGGSFRVLVAVGDAAFDTHSPSAATESPTTPHSAGTTADQEQSWRLQRADQAYALALAVFPNHAPTLRKRVLVLMTRNDPRALTEVSRLVKLDAASEPLHDLVEAHFRNRSRSPNDSGR